MQSGSGLRRSWTSVTLSGAETLVDHFAFFLKKKKRKKILKLKKHSDSSYRLPENVLFFSPSSWSPSFLKKTVWPLGVREEACLAC